MIHNLKVYIDIMVIKTLKEKNHYNDLKETLNLIKEYIMPLNPVKCVGREYSDQTGLEEGLNIPIL